MRTEDQINASRINGSKSTGATSPEGQNRCKTAAFKHGLTSEHVVVAPEEVETYNNLVEITFDHYRPMTPMEKIVIQEVANWEWKISKANVYESGLYVYGRMLNENLYKDHCPEDPRQRFVMVEGIIHQANSKTLTNLSLQMAKAHRSLEKRIAQFEKMRAEREVLELAQKKIALISMKATDGRPLHPSVGSIFPRDYLKARLEFEEAAGEKNLAFFDRAWAAKSSNLRS
jgi:hypothetical protein